ncbi:MAG: hypothetical protein ACI8Z7_000340 [Candidatus Nanohaloarchaea archaeon]|jgi:hypothetical protein
MNGSGTRKAISRFDRFFNTYLSSVAYMVVALGSLFLYMKNFNDPFNILSTLSIVSFTIGSLLLVVWSELNRKKDAEHALTISRRFLKSGSYFVLLLLITPIIRLEPTNHTVYGFQVPEFIIGAGDLLLTLFFAYILLAAVVNFGFGISDLIEFISNLSGTEKKRNRIRRDN